MNVVFMGTPLYVSSVIDALVSLGTNVVAVYTQPDRPAGRSRRSRPSEMKVYCERLGIKVAQPASLRSADVLDTLYSLSPDLIVVAAYGKILPSDILRIPRHGCINVHPSILPKYRGPSPVATALLNGDARTGVTIMVMDDFMDSGPILATKRMYIRDKGWTSGSLTSALFRVGSEMLKEVIPQWIAGEIDPKRQYDDRATYTKKLEKSDGEVDWGLPAQVLERRARAFTPWPGIFTYWNGRRLKLIDVKAREVHNDARYGASSAGLVVLRDNGDGYLGVVTGDGILELECVQIEGRRPVRGKDFAGGYPDVIGATLPS